MSQSNILIGQGSYGCVFKPPLKCKTRSKHKPNRNTVSKLMTRKNARHELSEFNIINSIDPDQKYHIGKPYICDADTTTPKFKRNISKCKSVKEKSNNLTLLMLDFGGLDLINFCEHLPVNHPNLVYKFWVSVYQLFRGLDLFAVNGINHLDLKPSNILYDIDQNKFNFIDFGLTSYSKTLVTNAKTNKYFQGVFHWSYPLENGFANREKYAEFKSMSSAKRNSVLEDIIKLVLGIKTKSTENIVMYADAFIFTFIYAGVDDWNSKVILLNAFYTSFLYTVDNMTYDEFIVRLIKTIDIYGLGLSLNYALDMFNKKGLLTNGFYISARALFSNMFNFDMNVREQNTSDLLAKYANILIVNGFKNPKTLAKFSRKSITKTPKIKLTSAKHRNIVSKNAIELIQSRAQSDQK